MNRLILVSLVLCSVSTSPAIAGNPAAAEIAAAVATSQQAAKALIGRVLPKQADAFVCEAIPADDGNDVFEIEAKDGKIVLRGNNGVGIASALNHYLKYTANCHIAWNGSRQLDLPNPLPKPATKIRVVSPNKFRFAYNYCTHGYTMAWWDWQQWEPEIDFLALSGINLALLIEGQEQVWSNTLQRYGYTAAEVRQWLVMPSHQPWMYMSNMEGYGGPVPQSLIDRRAKLCQRIIARMRELGIEPVLQGYYGIVPSTMRQKFPGAKIHAQGTWCGVKRPDMLDPTDPLFPRVAAAFYAEQTKLYGKVGFLAADPFHEGGSTTGINLGKCGRIIYESMQRAQPGVTWVLQAWQENPRQEMLDALDKSRLLVVMLSGEQDMPWRRRNSYNGTPWAWCNIQNFGGNTGMDGNLSLLADEPSRVASDPKRGRLCGIGVVPEGSDTNPIVWDLLLERSWSMKPVDLKQWLPQYVHRRYGARSAKAVEAWNLLNQLSYGGAREPEQPPFNTVLNARPSLNPNPKAREWAAAKVPYDPARLVLAWKLLLEAAPECGSSDGYRYDVADLTRQVLCDYGAALHGEILAAYRARDKAATKELSRQMLALFDDLDAVVSTRRECLLGVWIRDARRWGTTPEESDLCEHNARALLTIWAEPTTLADYANRSWAGLVKHFYKHRWAMWLGELDSALQSGKPLDERAVRQSIRQWEFDWVKQIAPTFAAEPTGDTIATAKSIYAKYTPIFNGSYSRSSK